MDTSKAKIIFISQFWGFKFAEVSAGTFCLKGAPNNNYFFSNGKGTSAD